MDNGISYVLTNYPFTQIHPDGDLQGTGYDVKVFRDKIYFGTSNGLYYTDWKENTIAPSYHLVAGTAGQVWGLSIVEEQLILSHADGAFVIQDGEAIPIFKDHGVWLFVQDRVNKDVAVAGTYKGLSVFSLPDFQHQYDLNNFAESSRFLEFDHLKNYWIAHPYRGIYKVNNLLDTAETTISYFGEATGLDSDLHNHVFKVGEQILFCSQNQVYLHDEEFR